MTKHKIRGFAPSNLSAEDINELIKKSVPLKNNSSGNVGDIREVVIQTEVDDTIIPADITIATILEELKKKPDKVYCVECKYCNLWNLSGPKCNHENAKSKKSTSFEEITEYSTCSNRNINNKCPDFEYILKKDKFLRPRPIILLLTGIILITSAIFFII